MRRDPMDVLHDLDGTCEYLVIDALEDVVGVGGVEDAVGVVDVAGAEGFGVNPSITWIQLVLRHRSFIWRIGAMQK